MAVFLAPIINDQQLDANGDPLSGGTIEVYLAGSSTPSTTYSDKAGLVPNTWPIVLNTLGVNNQGALWLTGGAAYKFVIKNSVGVVQRTIDNVSGQNDFTVTNDQWLVLQLAPTYISATSLSVSGDQTQVLQVNRRVRTQNTGGVVYGTITASVYGAGVTTVTVRNDSGALDSGLSQVSYGLISAIDSSLLFSVLLANPGYQRLPSGLVIQFGKSVAVTNASSVISVVFPVPFSAQPITVLATNSNVSAPNQIPTPSAGSATTIDFVVAQSNTGSGVGGGVTVGVNWIAVGR